MNNRLTIPDIAASLAERTGKDKQLAESFLKEFVAQVREGVYSDKIAKVKGIGTFKIILVDPRESIHVGTGERFLIPAHYKFSFLPDKELRDLVNKPFSFFETTELKENVDFTDLEASEEAEDKEADAEDESVEEVMPDEPQAEAAAPETPSEEEPEKPAESLPACPAPEEETLPDILPELISAPEEEMPEEETSQEKTPEEEDTEKTPEEENPSVPLPPDFLPHAPEAELPAENDAGFPEIDSLQTKKNAAVFRQYVVLGFALLMCCLGGAYLYVNRHFVRAILFGVEVGYPDTSASRAAAAPGSELPSAETETPPETETVPDTANASPAADPQPRSSRPVSEPAPPPASKLLGTVKIEPGSRLTLISLEYYGSKIFWVYLYEYNKARISDPNNIPVGTPIDIPVPEMYGIDARDKASVAKAAARQTEILAGAE